MHSIQNSFSKKRVLHYDHYDRFNQFNMSYEHQQRRAYNEGPGPSARRPFMPAIPSASYVEESPPPPLTSDPTFDILDWHPAYQSCQRFFLDHAQHEGATQALCALINIRLPFQYLSHPVESAAPPRASQPPPASSTYTPTYQRSGSSPPHRGRGSPGREPPTFVSLIPYVKRLVVTGFDKPAILHGLFGDDYKRGISPHLDCERRNYLFAAKHGGWSCKKQYDVGSGMGGDESVPFMKPLEETKTDELTAAEKAWSGWLAMEDWMVGPRAPKDEPEVQRSSPPRSNHFNGNDNGRAREDEVLPDGVLEAFENEGGVETNGDGRSPRNGREAYQEHRNE